MTTLKKSAQKNNPATLAAALLSLKNANEMRSFLRDLCTAQELREMDDRWAIAQLLDKKKTYRAIARKLDVSTTTVSRVAAWLNAGKGGYRIALDRLAQHHSAYPPKQT